MPLSAAPDSVSWWQVALEEATSSFQLQRTRKSSREHCVAAIPELCGSTAAELKVESTNSDFIVSWAPRSSRSGSFVVVLKKGET